MSRIPFISSPESLDADQLLAWEHIRASRGSVRGPFSILLHSPELARRTADLGSFLRFHSIVPADVRALACLATARHYDCQYAWSSNEALAREAGVREAAIVAIRDRRAPTGLATNESVVFTLVKDLLTTNRIRQESFDAALGRFTTRGLVELVGYVAYYANLSVTLNAFDLDPSPHFPRLLPE
jgi:4-carboxymuconolactone decarboxylase